MGRKDEGRKRDRVGEREEVSKEGEGEDGERERECE